MTSSSSMIAFAACRTLKIACDDEGGLDFVECVKHVGRPLLADVNLWLLLSKARWENNEVVRLVLSLEAMVGTGDELAASKVDFGEIAVSQSWICGGNVSRWSSMLMPFLSMKRGPRNKKRKPGPNWTKLASYWWRNNHALRKARMMW